MAAVPRSYEWQCVTEAAAFPGMDGAAALVFDGRMWLLGGCEYIAGAVAHSPTRL